MLEQKKNRRPRFRRADQAPAMRFQERDGEILQTIYEFDGVMTRRHLKQLFWPRSSQKAMEARLSKLYHNSYLDWPNAEQRRERPIPEPLVWLGWRGILTLAGIRGVQVKFPVKENENQLRLLQFRLRRSGVRWVREPNWNQPLHEIAVADFRLSILASLEYIPSLKIEQWISEGDFRANNDNIKFSYKGKNGGTRTRSKRIVPDGYFVLNDQDRLKKEIPHRAMFLLEMDMATHDNFRFGIEKALAGATYLQSNAYKDRFGSNTGRWLIVTSGIKRLQNLMQQTDKSVKSNSTLFYFSTIEKVISNNPLLDEIWFQSGGNEPISLPILLE